ncbi:hypothetical protein [Streptomyces poonensis]|uniref:Secreted protein n=1 Tax=Streptomyces poonensis TaxID=68255 RepID=A0A918UE14_9ACTN|nr:hypothetical protein [Streptomyces poonensis]GGY95200.1 hypothetical protein GCM10010365_12570 [Streptomyces poonensis]GLJ88788.1 hypothetical protein GCM10017589_13880 [Streptomyces poonensis]
MHTTRRVTTALTRTTLLAAVAVVLGAPGSPAAAQNPLPLPVAGIAAESLVGEGVTVEGPLVNNVNLPTVK